MVALMDAVARAVAGGGVDCETEAGIVPQKRDMH